MNLKLTREIYGNAWFIDPLTLSQYSKTLEFFQNGGTFDEKEPKANLFGTLSESNVFKAGRITRMDIVPQNTIAQYNFDSVITKGGGMSHFGTKDIGAQFAEMEANENVIGHMFNIESGGGSAAAIKYIREFSAKSARTKPLVVFAEDLMASAAMYIASDADHIIVNDKSSIVGSIGTMIQTDGFKNGVEDANGKRHLRIYATQSINKNKEFEDAINDLNFELIRSTILDPLAAEFIADMEINRPNITAIQKTGKIFRAEEVVGTLIDEIGTFQMAIDKIHELAELKPAGKQANNTPKSGDNHKSKIVKMATKEEFKAENPTAYAEIVNEGTVAERDRVEAWTVFNEVDPVKVKAGIESGKPLSGKAMAEFNFQAMSGKKVEAMKDESDKDIKKPAEAKTEANIKAEADKKEMDELFKEGAE